MKAYSVSDANGDTGVEYVIFAETRGKAIAYALNNCDGTFDYYGWLEMRALRKPQLDRCYRGRSEMDWNDMDDREAMVRYAGFRCSYEVTVSQEDCEVDCPAHEWCGRYESMVDRPYKTGGGV